MFKQGKIKTEKQRKLSDKTWKEQEQDTEKGIGIDKVSEKELNKKKMWNENRREDEEKK